MSVKWSPAHCPTYTRVVLTFGYEFATLCSVIFIICYYTVTNIIQKQTCRCYLDDSLVYCLNFERTIKTQNSKVVSPFSYKFATFSYIIFKIWNSIGFPDSKKIKINKS